MDIRDNPGFWWIGGLLFAGVGAAFVWLGLSNPDAAPAWQAGAAAGLGLSGVATGGWVLWSSPRSHIHLDTNRGVLTVTRTGLTGRQTRVIPLAEVRDLVVGHQADDDGAIMARPELLLQDGTILALSAIWRHDPQGIADQVRRLRGAAGFPPELPVRQG